MVMHVERAEFQEFSYPEYHKAKFIKKYMYVCFYKQMTSFKKLLGSYIAYTVHVKRPLKNRQNKVIMANGSF